ncbi:MAG: hypothetical protein U0835_02125 [Isosphaeraceae bacterium]
MTERRAAWLLIVLAVVARGAAVLVLQSHLVPHSTYEHGEIAANLLAGKGFSVRFLGADGPTSQQAPVYPLVVAAAYAVGGVGTPRALLILELGQALLGGVLVAGVMALAREAAPTSRRTAYAAALIASVHPTLVYAATHVQVALWAATMLVWVLVLGYRTGRTGRDRDALLGGGLLGLLVLTDPILGLSAAGFAWAAFRGDEARLSNARRLALAGLAALVVLAPWTWRNYRVHGEFVAVKSTFGYAFWQGNCSLSNGTDKVIRPSVDRALAQARAGGGFDLKGWNASLWKARHEAGYLDDIALTADDYRELSSLNEPARSRLLFARAVADLRADPWRYPLLCGRRLAAFVFWDDANPKARSLVYRAGQVGLTLAALLGLVLAPRDLRRRLGPTLLTALLVALFHSLTIVSVRFHVPIEPLMALWAASALARAEAPAAAEGPRLSGDHTPARSVSPGRSRRRRRLPRSSS